MFRFHTRSMMAAMSLSAALACPTAFAMNAPADPCSLLPAADVARIVGRAFDSPKSSVAPRPFPKTVQGTDCLYLAKSGHGALLFRVYFDPSAPEAAGLFKRLQMFFGSGAPVPGVGDETYIDSKHGLHERKGNVRFYLSLDGTNTAGPAKDKLLASLATAIGGRVQG